MDNEVPSAFAAALAMIRWRVDLMESALISELGDDPGNPRLAEALDALRSFRVPAGMARRLLEEGYAIRRAEEQAEQAAREAGPRPRNGLRVVTGRRPPAA